MNKLQIILGPESETFKNIVAQKTVGYSYKEMCTRIRMSEGGSLQCWSIGIVGIIVDQWDDFYFGTELQVLVVFAQWKCFMCWLKKTDLRHRPLSEAIAVGKFSSLRRS